MKKNFEKFLLILATTALFVGCGEGVSRGQMSAKQESKEVMQSTSKGQSSKLPQVYMTTDISSTGMLKVYQALGKLAKGNVAIKLHMGEPGNQNYLRPELLKELTQTVKGTFVDSNVYYGGARGNTEGHLQVAKEHGFTFAPVDILDAEGEVRLPINGGKRLQEAIIGSHYKNYDFIISIAHFKGHMMAGFGGTFKNLAVGMASKNGKGAIHNDSGGGMWSTSGNAFFEKIVEYTKAVIDDKQGELIYINVLNNLSVDCDCSAGAAHPEIKDIGILASLDPVALDKASVDLVYAAPEKERKHLVERIESRNGIYQLIYAEQLGLGSQKYELVKLD